MSDLTRKNYPKIENLMVRGNDPEGLPTLAFGNVVRTFYDAYGPDVVWGVTVRSAVPLADAVRGFYEGYGGLPRIVPIYANRVKAYSGSEKRLEWIQLEADRLSREHGIGAGVTVAVLDQFQGSGLTTDLAGEMAAATGARAVHNYPEKVRWYAETTGAIDVNTLTSRHAEFMRKVGRKASELGDAGDVQPITIQEHLKQN